ncbi:MAG: GNAT family N-acetyltransferase [Gammaproteobacteria bacterium]
MTDLIIRHAVAADAESLATLARASFVEAFGAQNQPEHLAAHCDNSFSASKQAQEIVDPARVTVLAQMGAALVGYVQVLSHSPNENVDAEQPAEVCRLYVLSAWHGRGVAQALMQEVLRVTAHADVLWLGVWEENPRGIAFYKKYGFEVVGRQIFDVGSDPQHDFVMAVSLENDERIVNK